MFTKKNHATPMGWRGFLERVMGIEPTSQAWEARILPMNYTRIGISIIAPRRVNFNTFLSNDSNSRYRLRFNQYL